MNENNQMWKDERKRVEERMTKGKTNSTKTNSHHLNINTDSIPLLYFWKSLGSTSNDLYSRLAYANEW